jgi:hypothetical protein
VSRMSDHYETPLRSDLEQTIERLEAENARLVAALKPAEQMMFDYGKAIHLKDVGLKDQAEPIRAACLAWLETVRAALTGTPDGETK